jgi:sec-independent protein translocase protein TatC
MSTVAVPVGRIRGPAWRDRLVEASVIGAAMLAEMPFLDHLEELRRRLLKSIIAVAATLVVCASFAAELITILEAPANSLGIRLSAIEGTEIFSVYFKVSLVCAICLAAPFILCQVWEFIAPGLHTHERRYAAPFILSTTLSFITGAFFGFSVLVPLALGLQIDMAKAVGFNLVLSAMSYFDLLFVIVLSMAIIFEIPAVIFILSRIGLVTAGFLARNLKYAVLLSFVAGALLTPSTDWSNMLLVALPMIALYVVGIGIAWLFGRPRSLRTAD